MLVANFVDEISHDGDVDRKHCNPPRSRMVADLVNLEWDQGAGDDYGEPFRLRFPWQSAVGCEIVAHGYGLEVDIAETGGPIFQQEWRRN